jgi:hypothetical protein
MTIRKLHSVSVMTLCGLIMLSCALLFPAKSMASSGGGCNETYPKIGGFTLDASYCFNTDLSGYLSNDVYNDNYGWDYELVGASITIRDVTAGQQVYSHSAYSNEGDVELDFDSSQFSPAPVSGHTYSMSARVCVKGSNSPGGECSNWTGVPALPNVIY